MVTRTGTPAAARNRPLPQNVHALRPIAASSTRRRERRRRDAQYALHGARNPVREQVVAGLAAREPRDAPRPLRT